MIIAYKYRVYPNNTQKQMLSNYFGCSRFIYNYFLGKSKQEYKESKITFNFYRACKELTDLKKELTWLCNADKFCLQNSLRDLDSAFKNFYNGSKFPKFKKKRINLYSYRTSYTNNNIEYRNRKIKIPKVGWIKTRDKRVPDGRIINATVSLVPSGKYFISICCENNNVKQYDKTNNRIGIDLGIKNFAITSNGIIIDNPKFLNRSLNKLAKLQKDLSRKSKGGSNRNKARIKVARQYEKIANQRKDFLQKITTMLVKENDIICIEDLNILHMMDITNTQMRRSILDVSWGEFSRELQYKADWHGKQIIKVDTFFASSQICHYCGCKSDKTKDLSVRNWVCPNCGKTLNRDINAAINILNEGLKQVS